MKKHISLITAAISMSCILGMCPVYSFAAEDATSVPEQTAYFTSAEDITLEKICDSLKPIFILDKTSGFRIDQSISGANDENLETGKFFMSYVKLDDIIYFNQFADYQDGYFNHLYYSTDPEDINLYVETPSSVGKQPASSEKLFANLNLTVLEYEAFDNLEITSIDDADGKHIIEVSCIMNDVPYFIDTITVDAESGLIDSVETLYFNDNGSEADTVLQTFSYGDDIKTNQSPRTNYYAKHPEEGK